MAGLCGDSTDQQAPDLRLPAQVSPNIKPTPILTTQAVKNKSYLFPVTIPTQEIFEAKPRDQPNWFPVHYLCVTGVDKSRKTRLGRVKTTREPHLEGINVHRIGEGVAVISGHSSDLKFIASELNKQRLRRLPGCGGETQPLRMRTPVGGARPRGQTSNRRYLLTRFS